MFRSIRWTLQMWHAAILATVLIVFGWVVFYLVRVTTYQQIDASLDRMADLVSAGLRPRRRPPDLPRPTAGAPVREALVAKNPNDKAEKDKASTAKTATEGPTQAPGSSVAGGTERAAATPPLPGERFAGRRGPRGEMRFELNLNEDFPRFFEDQLGAAAYFVVWRGDGTLVVKSQSANDIPLPETHWEPHVAPVSFVRQRGMYRETIHQFRADESRARTLYILVGRSIEGDVAAIYDKAWLLGGVGFGVLALGLIGGFWFSGRAIKPIEAISAAAAEISLSNLSRRIDVSGTETELTGLARTLNQMIDRLESAFAQQVRFTADASHELRTPLAVILSHAELALDKSRPAGELRETIETCRRSALRMKSVVESLLTLARFDSGELQLDCRPIDLSRITGDCAALLRPLAEKRGIALELDLESAGLVADQDRISQVVTNLLTNAIRYNHDNGRVMVTTRSSKSDVVLSVADTGIGIGPEHLPHIFERFYRVDKARSRKDGGIGLGLAICKSIVEAHGGQISVTSSAEGATQFEVRLPKRGALVHDETRQSEETRLEPVAMSAKV
ncbi:MAG TPA: ATP-binding protein [Planctomycetaceae bacterium]|nr:ATP-binding protein [Planctomycetaceae bacterium]